MSTFYGRVLQSTFFLIGPLLMVAALGSMTYRGKMHPVDWAIVGGYLVGMIGLSALLMRGQRSARDYYLGGNRTGALPIALSTVATQCSTNSLLGAPAFVGFVAGGGLIWLQYELAVPLAMIVLMACFYPVFRGLRLVSLYEYLERRFDVRVRLAVSVVFQLLRAFATGVTIFGVCLVLEMILGIPYWLAVIILGVVTVIYDILGGMRAVIWSDVIQIGVLWGAILVAIGVCVQMLGGVGEVMAFVEPERVRALDFSSAGFDGNAYTFLPMLIGGFFLYLAYYGTDQTQAQRELSTRSERETTKALFYDGLLRFPLVLSYCFLGLCLAAWASRHPEFIGTLQTLEGETNYNLAVPVFVLNYFPVGLVGLVMAGLIAAAMSSLDSTLNALSALSTEDFVRRRKSLSPRADLLTSKAFTLFWGTVCIGFSFFVGGIATTVIESVNKISSLLNGPLLAVFLLGLFTRRASAGGALVALVSGFVINLGLAFFAPSVSWLWWNVFGSLGGFLLGYLFSLGSGEANKDQLSGTLSMDGMKRYEGAGYLWSLLLYALGIFAFLWWLSV